MSPLYLLLLFFMSTSDSEFKLCSARKTYCFELTDRIDVSIPTRNQSPCLTVCTDRKLSPIPRSNPNVVVSLLLLLSGDISLNPGPSPSPIKLDVVTVTETWLSTMGASASLADVTPNGFKLVQNPRKGRGVARQLW